MAFNLQKVLKALLFSSSQPLSVKDIQAAFARFHEQPVTSVVTEEETEAGGVKAPAAGEPVAAGEGEQAPAETTPPGDEAAAPDESAVAGAVVAAEEALAEVIAEAPIAPTDAELYQDVPSLVTATQIREAMDALSVELKATNDVYLVVEGPTGYRLVTHPRFARWIRILRDEPPPVKLSQSALETLAIVAYRQPVTRTEIETIRGVSAEAGLNKLLERELVYIVGRADLPGRPLQYGTTDKFMDFVGVKSLVELPASDVLSPRQIDEWLQNAINPSTPTDAEMGLPLEEGEGTSPNRDNVSMGSNEPAAPIESPVNVPAGVVSPVEESPSAVEPSSADEATGDEPSTEEPPVEETPAEEPPPAEEKPA